MVGARTSSNSKVGAQRLAADQNTSEVVEHSLKLQVQVSSEGVGTMNGVIYLIGLVVVVLAILSFLGFN